MARKPRLDVPDAFYHVIARGNRRAALFHDDVDYCAYLERYRQRNGLTCSARNLTILISSQCKIGVYEPLHLQPCLQDRTRTF
jgi:hypothetical protein